MLSKWNWIIFNFIVCVTIVPLNGSLSEDEIKAFLQLIELDYEDACYNTSNIQWSFIISPSNKTLSIWVNILSNLHLFNHVCIGFLLFYKLNLLCYFLGSTTI